MLIYHLVYLKEMIDIGLMITRKLSKPDNILKKCINNKGSLNSKLWKNHKKLDLRKTQLWVKV